MPGGLQMKSYIADGDSLRKIDRLKKRHAGFSSSAVIQWFRMRMFAELVPRVEPGILFLNIAAIGK